MMTHLFNHFIKVRYIFIWNLFHIVIYVCYLFRWSLDRVLQIYKCSVDGEFLSFLCCSAIFSVSAS